MLRHQQCLGSDTTTFQEARGVRGDQCATSRATRRLPVPEASEFSIGEQEVQYADGQGVISRRPGISDSSGKKRDPSTGAEGYIS